MRMCTGRIVLFVALTSTVWGAGQAVAVECSSPARMVAAAASETNHAITTAYQFDDPNLQLLLATTIDAGEGCLVAHLSALTRITDNYVAFQVSVDGVPMVGHLGGLGSIQTPVVFVSIDASSFPPLNDEQLIDPVKVVAYNFFLPVTRGTHTVEVWAAAGSGIDFSNPSTVNNLVLTLEYR